MLKQALKDAYDREVKLEQERQALLKSEEDKKRALTEQKQREKEAEIARQKAELEAKEEAARKEKEREAAEKAKLEVEKQNEKAKLTNYGAEDAVALADEYLAKLKHIKETVDKQVKSDRAMMTEALRYRMKFTTKIGAVTNSRRHIQEFYQELTGILTQGKHSELLYTWLLNNMAKQIVKQSETEVSVNFNKAFPLATLACLLICDHPELLKLILARMMKKCPYVVPRYPKREQGETDDQLRKKMGYREVEEGKFESEQQFQERMNGIIALYAAMIQADLADFGKQNPYGMIHGWSWLARMLNMTPRKITPGAIETFLKIAGHGFLMQYGKQGHKLMQFIHQDYLQRIGKGAEGAKVRLELLLEEYFKKGRVDPHDGQGLRP